MDSPRRGVALELLRNGLSRSALADRIGVDLAWLEYGIQLDRLRQDQTMEQDSRVTGPTSPCSPIAEVPGETRTPAVERESRVTKGNHGRFADP